MYVLQFYLLPLHRRIYVYTPSPLYIYIFTRSHPQIYLSTSPHPHICTSISHLYIHTVAPSHLSCLSFFLSFYISFLSPLYIYIFARSHPQIYLYTTIHLHIYIIYRTCTSTLSLLHVHPLFLSVYISFRQCWTITCLALGPSVV